MTLVFQILVPLLILVGLIAIIMSIKNWHWAQMLLLLTIFFVSILDLVLGLEVYRIHRNIRKPIPAKELQLAELEAKIEALKHGTRDQTLVNKVFSGEMPFNYEAEGRMPSMSVWEQRLQMQARERGRVWTGVKPGGQLDAKEQVTVQIPAPRPHGLEKDAIVYAFEQMPAAAAPAPPGQGPQYLGEFRVMDVNEGGAILHHVQGLDPRTGQRLANSIRSGRPWKLYETMPVDSHELFAGLSEAQLKQMLPASSVNEYLRQGTLATPNDDDNHKAGYDEEGHRVGPDAATKAAKWLYDRPLREYAIMFTELAREKSVMLAEIAGLIEDNNRLKAAQENALKLQAHREKETAALTVDLKQMQRDRSYIEKLLKSVQQELAEGKAQTTALLQKNAAGAQQLVESQLAQLRSIVESTAAAGAPAPQSLPTPQ